MCSERDCSLSLFFQCSTGDILLHNRILYSGAWYASFLIVIVNCYFFKINYVGSLPDGATAYLHEILELSDPNVPPKLKCSKTRRMQEWRRNSSTLSLWGLVRLCRQQPSGVIN